MSEETPIRPFVVQPAPQRRPASGLIWVLVLLLVIWLLPDFVRRMKYAATIGREQAEVEVARTQMSDLKVGQLGHVFGLVAKSVGPSVVHINTVQRQMIRGRRDELDALLGGRVPEARGQGSGVIIDAENGYIITNNHVIAGATSIQVILSSGEELPASVQGSDQLLDLAVLRVPARNLIAAEWGDSDKLEVGSLVWAIGNPFGLDRSVTFGIISAKDRNIFEGTGNPYQSFLQTDAAVNPGNSGGPLVNVEGQVVGINTAIIGRAYQGISFSIPSAVARDVYDKILKNGRVTRGYLGVQLAPLEEDVARKLGLTSVEGALVVGVQDDSPAEKAGLQPGDVIINWNGQEISDPQTLTLIVAQSTIGSKAEVIIIREGEKATLTVEVEERPVD
jgi:serine protease Do